MTTTDSQYEFTVKVPELSTKSAFNATLSIKVAKPTDASGILHYLRGVQIKNDFVNNWVRKNAPDCGMEIRGGPRPVFQDPADRASPVIAYEQDFRLTPRI